jgi:hypothetical protein
MLVTAMQRSFRFGPAAPTRSSLQMAVRAMPTSVHGPFLVKPVQRDACKRNVEVGPGWGRILGPAAAAGSCRPCWLHRLQYCNHPCRALGAAPQASIEQALLPESASYFHGTSPCPLPALLYRGLGQRHARAAAGAVRPRGVLLRRARPRARPLWAQGARRHDRGAVLQPPAAAHPPGACEGAGAGTGVDRGLIPIGGREPGVQLRWSALLPLPTPQHQTCTPPPHATHHTPLPPLTHPPQDSIQVDESCAFATVEWRATAAHLLPGCAGGAPTGLVSDVLGCDHITFGADARIAAVLSLSDGL